MLCDITPLADLAQGENDVGRLAEWTESTCAEAEGSHRSGQILVPAGPRCPDARVQEDTRRALGRVIQGSENVGVEPVLEDLLAQYGLI